ncbi:CACTA en-spm transposon protein [Cucumis melo var. makuwa]|nr:CACTA en-spm transposon protein [Cucumis melo var. makuwa]
MVSRGAIMSSSYPRNNFMETDAIFLEFEDDLDNIAGGSSSMGDNTGGCVRKTFPVRCLKWADIGREYIEVVKGDLQRLFVLDFNDQAMNRFVEHQMLTTFKEFRADCYKHFKKYSDPEEARANPPNALNQMVELQSQPTLEGSQPLSEDEICDQVLGRRPGYSWLWLGTQAEGPQDDECEQFVDILFAVHAKRD